MAENGGIWGQIGRIGGAMVAAAAGYGMTRFEPKAGLAWEEQMKWPVRITGYALIGYAAYDAMRDWLSKGKG